jgi:hypothetical protein
MKDEILQLQRAVGSDVTLIGVDLLFDGEEETGTIGNVVLEISHNRRFSLSCAGDGSIFVAPAGKKQFEDAPGITRQTRAIEGVEGDLQDVVRDDASLHLRIGEIAVKVTNNDDELSVEVDDIALPRDYFRRTEIGHV